MVMRADQNFDLKFDLLAQTWARSPGEPREVGKLPLDKIYISIPYLSQKIGQGANELRSFAQVAKTSKRITVASAWRKIATGPGVRPNWGPAVNCQPCFCRVRLGKLSVKILKNIIFQKIKNRSRMHQKILLWSYNVPKDDYKPTLGSNMVMHVDQNFDLKNWLFRQTWISSPGEPREVGKLPLDKIYISISYLLQKIGQGENELRSFAQVAKPTKKITLASARVRSAKNCN